MTAIPTKRSTFAKKIYFPQVVLSGKITLTSFRKTSQRTHTNMTSFGSRGLQLSWIFRTQLPAENLGIHEKRM